MKMKLLCVLICGGCAANEPVATNLEKRLDQAEAPLSSDASVGATRAQLAARIDASALELGPTAPLEAMTPFTAERVLEALERATGARFEVKDVSDGRWSATSSRHQVSYDGEDGAILVETAENYRRGIAHAPDSLFETRAKALFAAFAPDSASAQVTLMHLGSTARDTVSNEELSDERLGTKVFALRRLGGLRVAANRMVASYNTDGTLRTVRGRWPEINLDASRLTSTLTEDEAVARALDTLIAHGVKTTDASTIPLESFYELRPVENGWAAVLRGAAVMQTYGTGGEEGRRERHDFDL